MKLSAVHDQSSALEKGSFVRVVERIREGHEVATEIHEMLLKQHQLLKVIKVFDTSPDSRLALAAWRAWAVSVSFSSQA